MAVKGVGYVTLADVAKKGDKVAEVLTLKNQVLKDIPYTEMNEGTIHKEPIRSFLPKLIEQIEKQNEAQERIVQAIERIEKKIEKMEVSLNG